MNEPGTESTEVRVLGTEEKDLSTKVSKMELIASETVIDSDETLEQAGEFTSEIKLISKKVEEYWEPLRVAAKTAYDNVLSKKKEMLEPLKNAEATLKERMGSYITERDARIKAEEEASRKRAQEEANRKLEEAVEAQERGDIEAAEYAIAEAEMADVYASTPTKAHKTKGSAVSTRTSWEIESIDESLVPVSLNGIVIRPVDKSLVMNLIKMSKGKVEIPGVKYKESSTVCVKTAKKGK